MITEGRTYLHLASVCKYFSLIIYVKLLAYCPPISQPFTFTIVSSICEFLNLKAFSLTVHRLVNNQVFWHCVHFSFQRLHLLQHGFHDGHSCEPQLLLTVHELMQQRDTNSQIDMAILELSKAFDTVPRDNVLIKFQHNGPILDINIFKVNRPVCNGRWKEIRVSKSWLRCTTRDCFRAPYISPHYQLFTGYCNPPLCWWLLSM